MDAIYLPDDFLPAKFLPRQQNVFILYKPANTCVISSERRGGYAHLSVQPTSFPPSVLNTVVNLYPYYTWAVVRVMNRSKVVLEENGLHEGSQDAGRICHNQPPPQ